MGHLRPTGGETLLLVGLFEFPADAQFTVVDAQVEAALWTGADPCLVMYGSTISAVI